MKEKLIEGVKAGLKAAKPGLILAAKAFVVGFFGAIGLAGLSPQTLEFVLKLIGQ